MQRQTIDKSAVFVPFIGLFLHSVHSHTSCSSIYVNHFETVGLFASDPRIFNLQKSESEATSASALKLQLPQEFLQMMRGGKVPTGGNAL